MVHKLLRMFDFPSYDLVSFWGDGWRKLEDGVGETVNGSSSGWVTGLGRRREACRRDPGRIWIAVNCSADSRIHARCGCPGRSRYPRAGDRCRHVEGRLSGGYGRPGDRGTGRPSDRGQILCGWVMSPARSLIGRLGWFAGSHWSPRLRERSLQSCDPERPFQAGQSDCRRAITATEVGANDDRAASQGPVNTIDRSPDDAELRSSDQGRDGMVAAIEAGAPTWMAPQHLLVDGNRPQMRRRGQHRHDLGFEDMLERIGPSPRPRSPLRGRRSKIGLDPVAAGGAEAGLAAAIGVSSVWRNVMKSLIWWSVICRLGMAVLMT